jgi:GntR family transcriptional regulator
MPTNMYEQLADDLRGKIRSGEYPPGSMLPSRRELCEEHGFSEIVVYMAVQILKREGLVELAPGRGVRVVGRS